jgi:hypothetical protein
MIPEEKVRVCNYTVLKPVTCEKIIHGCKLESRKVPYTITQSVPKVVSYQVPVQVYRPAPCKKVESCD